MRKLSKYEKETIINWNEGETIASIYTSVSYTHLNRAVFRSPRVSSSSSSLAVTSRSSAMSNTARRAPQEIRIDVAVFPETKSQGLFHQIQKEVTFCGLPHAADA